VWAYLANKTDITIEHVVQGNSLNQRVDRQVTRRPLYQEVRLTNCSYLDSGLAFYFSRTGSNSMYYSNGNYEAFARPEKPKNVENKSAYLVGAGIASLAAACFLVRDGQMKGANIHILE
jgi:hypothetical protein